MYICISNLLTIYYIHIHNYISDHLYYIIHESNFSEHYRFSGKIQVIYLSVCVYYHASNGLNN